MNDAGVQTPCRDDINTDNLVLAIKVQSHEILFGLILEEMEFFKDFTRCGDSGRGVEVVGDLLPDGQRLEHSSDLLEPNGSRCTRRLCSEYCVNRHHFHPYFVPFSAIDSDCLFIPTKHFIKLPILPNRTGKKCMSLGRYFPPFFGKNPRISKSFKTAW